MQRQACGPPAALNGAVGSSHNGSGFELREPLIPEQIQRLAFVVGQVQEQIQGLLAFDPLLRTVTGRDKGVR